MWVKCFWFEMRQEQQRLRWKSRCATKLLLIHQRGKLKTRLHKNEGSSETHLSTEAGDFTRPHQLCTAVFCCNITQCFILSMTYLDCCSNSGWLQMVLISSVRLIYMISVWTEGSFRGGEKKWCPGRLFVRSSFMENVGPVFMHPSPRRPVAHYQETFFFSFLFFSFLFFSFLFFSFLQ